MITRYLSIPEKEIPEKKENARERQRLEQIQKKQEAIDKVRKLYSEEHSIDEITRITCHVSRTVKKYPSPGQLYTLLKEFHRIAFSVKSDELDSWMASASKLKANKIDRYIKGLKNNHQAVKNP